MKAFNVLALDENFDIVDIVAFIDLQWSRKWHECGSFSMQVPIEQYKTSWKYIFTKDRPEVGEITQINYFTQNGKQMMCVSGYFLERQLDRMVCFPRPKIVDQRASGKPSMSNLQQYALLGQDGYHAIGRACNVAYQYFESFKEVWFYNDKTSSAVSNFRLNIVNNGYDEDSSWKIADHYANGEHLGQKIYDILKPSGGSYRVTYSFDDEHMHFRVKAGKDRTSDNDKNNEPIVFSTLYGNVRNPNIVFDSSEKKDAIVALAKYQTNDGDGTAEKMVEHNSIIMTCAPNAEGYFESVTSEISITDYKLNDNYVNRDDASYNTIGFRNASIDKNLSTLNSVNISIINIAFDSTIGTYEYMEDFDIGDLVSLEVPEIGLSADVRIIGCYETMQNGLWELNLEFGEPIVK